MSHDQDGRHVHIYMVETFKKLLLLTQKADDFETWFAALFTHSQVLPNDDLGLTLTYFTARSNLVVFVFI